MQDLTDKEVLNIFREFVLKNVTQTKMGWHTHPIWVVVAEHLVGMPDIKSGPYWTYIQSGNQLNLEQLIKLDIQSSNCPICKGRKIVWRGGQGGDWEKCECQEL